MSQCEQTKRQWRGNVSHGSGSGRRSVRGFHLRGWKVFCRPAVPEKVQIPPQRRKTHRDKRRITGRAWTLWLSFYKPNQSHLERLWISCFYPSFPFCLSVSCQYSVKYRVHFETFLCIDHNICICLYWLVIISRVELNMPPLRERDKP